MHFPRSAARIAPHGVGAAREDRPNPREARSGKLARALFAYPAAVAGVAAVTALIHLVPGAEHMANASMLYLLLVIAVAVGFGSGAGVAASVMAVLAIDWFCVDPRYQWTVSDPAEWLALVAFLVTALVTGQLMSTLRSRAEEAGQREREAAALAEASWAVSAQVQPERALAEVLTRLSEVTSLEAAALFRAAPSGTPECAAQWGDAAMPVEVLQPAVRLVIERGRAVNLDEDPRHWRKALPQLSDRDVLLPLQVEHRVLGAAWLRFTVTAALSPPERRVMESLCRHAAIVLERDRLLRSETRARAISEADRLKTALLAMVSHDFRSPLTAIKAAVTGLLQEGASWEPEALRELLSGIDQETDRLNRMVGNVLTLSRLEAGAWQSRVEPTSVEEWIGTTLDSLGPEENARIVVAVEPGLPEVNIDPVQMVQVLRNLLDNALKYSPELAPVELRACLREGRLIVEVADSGTGLPAGEEERVFEPFYRAPELRESAVPGMGLGLAVCKGLVDAHHGEIEARRTPVGSVFRVSLPAEAAG